MKKSLMLIGNVLIIMAVLAFVTLSVHNEQDELLESKTEAFVNVTRAYTNPVNAIQSIAFCSRVTLVEGEAVQAFGTLK